VKTDGMMEVWKLLLLVVEAGAWVAACIDCVISGNGSVNESVEKC
jgi:hypothetical protein